MSVADGALTRVALVREVTMGTTPTSPAFIIARTVTAQATPQANKAPSDAERRSDRALGSTYRQVGGAAGSINCRLCNDDALDTLFESLMGNVFASDDTLVNGVSKLSFTQENLYEQGASDTYVRTTGNLINQLTFRSAVDQEVDLTFDVMGMGGSDGSAILSGATYAPASTGDCFTALDCVVNGAFGLSTPKINTLDFTVAASVRRQAAHGSASPFGLGLGRFRVTGTVELYFEDKAQLDAALANSEGALDLTFGTVTGERYRFYWPRAEISSYEIVDGGNDTDHFLRLSWTAKHSTVTGYMMQITRNAP